MQDYALIAAIGTPLTEREMLHIDALKLHIEEQWRAGVTGILAGGTMGVMQLLTDETYRQLVQHASQFSAGRGELMIGVGDASFARTRNRIEFVNDHRCDGVVVLSPYLIKFSQDQLFDYFTALADLSRWPVYLYDLPGLTGVKLEIDTVVRLSKHRNIRGIKCSCDAAWIRQLVDLALPNFRVIAAQADLIDVLMRHGIRQHLDGVFCLAPHLAPAICRAALAGEWGEAASTQRRLSALLLVLKRYGVFPAFSALMNARGVPGTFAPAPFQPPDEPTIGLIMNEPAVLDLLNERPSR